MSSKRSSSKVYVTQGSPPISGSSSSFRSSSGTSSPSSSYTSSSYGYNYDSSATSNMGGSGYSTYTPSGSRREILRVPDPSRSRDGISQTSRRNVDVINHEKRHDEREEPRVSNAKSSDCHKSSSNRKPKK